jgi:hypothetical protein
MPNAVDLVESLWKIVDDLWMICGHKQNASQKQKRVVKAKSNHVLFGSNENIQFRVFLDGIT